MCDEPVSRYYTSQRLRLHYAVWGDEANLPLLLIHGNRDHARTWDQVAVRLKDRFCVYAVDLRGHGDSEWAVGGLYSMPEFVLDIAMLGAELNRNPLTIIGHSLGGAVSLQYTGTFPQFVKKVVAIEGLGPPVREPTPASTRMKTWVKDLSEFGHRKPRRYATVEDAVRRMMEENPHLTREMAHHLTVHGSKKNDDGSLSWKFDNYVRLRSPYEFNIAEAREIWNQIRCPVLLIRGSESWASDPEADGKASSFHDYRTELVKDAGHWVHHDQLEKFMDIIWSFV
jgi:pimeloyl-ACP methyl ester carboxylesterase